MTNRRDGLHVRGEVHHLEEETATNARSSNVVPVIRADGLCIRWLGRHPRSQRLKQVTNVLRVDALADFGSTTIDIGANGW